MFRGLGYRLLSPVRIVLSSRPNTATEIQPGNRRNNGQCKHHYESYQESSQTILFLRRRQGLNWTCIPQTIGIFMELLAGTVSSMSPPCCRRRRLVRLAPRITFLGRPWVMRFWLFWVVPWISHLSSLFLIE